MAVTIREVARAAGVSPAAASKALHGGDARVRVGSARIAEIRRVAKELNYYRNAHAGLLRGEATRTIGVLFEGFSNIAGGPLYYMHLLDGIASELFARHYRLTLLPEVDHEDLIGSLADGRLDGVVWCKLADHEVRALTADCPIPIVAMNADPSTLPAGIPGVVCDNAGGVELAVGHLWDLGHRRIVFLHESEESEAPDLIVRRAAFVDAMTRRGVRAEIAAWSWDLTEFRAWWEDESPERATAMIAWSERCAGALLKRASECGLSLPQELSVIGFDSTAYCDTLSPRLTAIHQPIAEMARAATRRLLSLLEPAFDEGSIPSDFSRPFPCSLHLRDSTARPSQSRASL